MCALGPITVGYNNPKVNEAVINQVKKFSSGSLQSELEVQLAEKLCQIVPCAEMEDVKPYCSSKLLDLSVSILVRITLLIIIAISYTLLKFR